MKNHPIPRLNRSAGSAKTWALVALIVLVAVMVPIGLYFISTIQFTNGTTSSNLSAPDTGVTAPAAPAARQTTAAIAPSNNANVTARTKTLVLTVVDQDTQQPIADMAVHTTGRQRLTGRTDAGGVVKIPVPAGDPENFNIRVSGKGYVSQRLQWATYRPDLQGKIPDAFTMKMGRTANISGRVVDDQGQPVAGAFVALQFSMKFPDPHEEVEDVWGFDADNPRKTDADGHWEYHNAPAHCPQIGLVAFDYKHVVPDFWQATPYPEPAKLYDGTGTFVLRSGTLLQGSVTDTDGKPVSGAKVLLGDNAMVMNKIPPESTDAQGKFTYVLEPGHHAVLTATAPGFAPQMLEVDVGNKTQDVAFKMTPPHRIHGQVVNPSGRGVANARIYLQSWNGRQTIQANFVTDGAGNFHWNDAPADPVTVSVNAPNLRGVNDAVLQPDTDNVVKLFASVHVRGTVTDAQTGQPVENYHLEFGIEFNREQPIAWQPGWGAQQARMLPGGKFEFTDDFNYPGIAVRIIAPGYNPTDSKVIRAEDGDTTLDLQMKPGKDVVAVVRTPDGKPVSGAMAVLALPGQPVFVEDSRTSRNFGVPQQTTGDDGKIDFPPQSGEFTIAVFGDPGYAEVTSDVLARSPDIKLAPWGKIHGKLMVGSKPGAGQTIEVIGQNQNYEPGKPQITNQLSADVASDGSFAIDRVPPGSWSVDRRIPMANNGWSFALLATVDVAAGQTATVNVGGTGRPVEGKIVLPAGVSIATRFYNDFSIVEQSAQDMMPPIPDDIKKASSERQQQWLKSFLRSDAGKAWAKKFNSAQINARRYPFAPKHDGSFHVDDVLAGDYTLVVNIRTMGGQNNQPTIAAAGSLNFTVPEMPGGRSDEPLDLPPVQVVKLEKYKPGDVVYDLSLKSPDGKELKLSSFRGKFLLLDFRIGGNQPENDLRNAFNSYGPDRLTILSLSQGRGWFNVFAPTSQIPWQQATLANDPIAWAVLATSFDLQGQRGINPTGAWLLDPNGAVVAGDLKGPALMDALSTALGPPGATTAPTTQPAITQ